MSKMINFKNKKNDIKIKSYILEDFFEKKQINEYNFNCELGSNVVMIKKEFRS